MSTTSSMPVQCSYFGTPLGIFGVAWADRGIVRTFLPERSEDAARAQLARRLPDAHEGPVPDDVRRLAADVARLLTGEQVDLGWVQLDDAGVPAFDRSVYAVARTIPPGATITYGDVARRLGNVALSRDVGVALGRNPFPIVVPCHRVLAAGGRTGGFSAPGGTETKMHLLRIEGAILL